MVKLTIIIPYYETYNLTLRLLKELTIQKNDETEVILIDDSGKDDFKNIEKILGLNEIRIIKHQKNMGVAKSRNEGIELARGKYIAFIDSDDQITMDYVDTLLQAIDTYDTDVINFNWYDMTEHAEHKKPRNPAPWKQIYKKETMQRFREDLLYGREDVDWQETINKGGYSITYLDKLLYFYNSNREGSLFWRSKHEVN